MSKKKIINPSTDAIEIMMHREKSDGPGQRQRRKEGAVMDGRARERRLCADWISW